MIRRYMGSIRFGLALVTVLTAALAAPGTAEAGCGINVGTITDSSIEIRYDSTSCKKTRDGIELCLKKSWDTVGACNGGTSVKLGGQKGSYTFGSLAASTAYKIKVLSRTKNGWPQLGKTTTSTLPPVVGPVSCNGISHPTLFDYTGDSVKIAFQSGGGNCNPLAYLVQTKYWYQRWLDAAVFNTGAGQFGTNDMVLKGIVEGLVALGIVAPENKDKVMEKLQSIQGTGHKVVALAGPGTKHQVTIGGLSGDRRYYARVFAVDASGEISSYDAHTVKTPSKGVFKHDGAELEWTEWLDRDDPGGAGDYETLSDFAEAAVACEQPVAVECRTRDGRSWQDAGQTYRCEPEVGGVCVNAQQPGTAKVDDGPVRGSGGVQLRDAAPRVPGRAFTLGCLDYEVRFLCPAP